ncbi:MAG: DUF4837 family protein [Candidatus Marinimicrobia bacterium]|nr:DUF4837 family protein [Candidatus Neomarinimicrobiota bacterium]
MKKILFAILAMILLLYSCGFVKDPAKGAFDKVIVLANEEMQDTLKNTVDDCFSYGIRTPAFQEFFYTQWEGIGKFETFSEYKNVILIANPSEKGQERNMLKAILPEKNYQLVLQDSLHIFSLEDPFAKDQVMIIIAGSDIEQIRENIKEQKDWIYTKIDKEYIDRVTDYIYKQYENKGDTRHIWKNYAWTFRVPNNYKILEEKKNFIWLGRQNPFRWISFYWEKGFNTDLMSMDGLLEQRNQMGAWYDSVGTDTSALGFYYTTFNGRDALKMYGLWFHKKQTKGGPFASYAFYDEHTDRTFVVDYLIYYPGHRVTNLFRQLDIVVKTFTTRYKEK